MCGRAKLPEDVSEIKLDLKIDWDKLGDYRPKWNAPPTTDMPVVISSQGTRSLELMRWGLIPASAKEAKVGRSTINVRAEGIDRQPMLQSVWQARRRCLVIADAYYEWCKTDRQPFAVALENRGPMTFAGLWDSWRAPDGVTIRSFAIITRANELLATIHHRMPVVLASDHWPAWLGEVDTNDNDLKAMLTPYPPERMTMWPVDKRVGNVRNDSPDLLDPIGDALTLAR